MRNLLIVCLFTLSFHSFASTPVEGNALAKAVRQLQSVQGQWQVITSFLNADSSIAKQVEGTYQFDWVVKDRVLSGTTQIPELQQTSGILFYIDQKNAKLEMVSVGADGNLWIMSGPLDSEVRYSQIYSSADGTNGQLKFTRFNVSNDQFESKMEYTQDGGASWQPGNHQLFKRIKPEKTK